VQPSEGKQNEVTWRVTLGGAILIFFIGSTFWAGATYNRIDGIEAALKTMSNQMGSLGELPVLKMKVESLEIEVQRLQTQRDRDRSQR
jgi:hypothetical protein